jgi:cellulose synthase/poly-beta-1,6-N-acetylglucosamine synthase-like glycosyltransferase
MGFPRITVQLPVYNERFVVARLIDAAACMEWPADRIEIQVLDDSVDDTRDIVDERAAYWSARGIPIDVVRRPNREGYKAGALAFGLARASGEFIAVFDADFLPPCDFLIHAIGPFADPHVGVVQARWGFLNADESWLTRAQAVMLSAHFRIEHQVRHARRLFFNFNGTAGIWRRCAIEGAGGWQDDTVTEDLDLSYRAQIAGWRFVYLDDLIVESELPATLSALRTQQMRWAKGSIQTARKILPRILSSDLPLPVKAESTVHLLANFGWLLGTVLVATLYPAVLCRVGLGIQDLIRVDMPLLLGSSGAILLYFAIVGLAERGWSAVRSVLLLPLLSVGLAPSIATAVITGLVARGGVFERTPKFGILGGRDRGSWALSYNRWAVTFLLVNLLLGIYSLFPVAFAVDRATWTAIPFLLLYPIGFGMSVLQDLRERLSNATARR